MGKSLAVQLRVLSPIHLCVCVCVCVPPFMLNMRMVIIALNHITKDLYVKF